MTASNNSKSSLAIDPILSQKLDDLFQVGRDEKVWAETCETKARARRKQSYLGLLGQTVDLGNRLARLALKTVFIQSPSLVLAALQQAEAAAEAIRPGGERRAAAQRYVQSLRVAATRLAELHTCLKNEAEILDNIDAGR